MNLRLRLPEGEISLSYEDFEERVRRGEIGPEIELCYPEVTGRDFLPVGELELYQILSNPEQRRFEARLRNGIPLATALLVGLQVRIFFLGKLPGGEDLIISHFTNWAPAVLETGEIWRLFTYGWLHLGLNHLALNMLFLGYAGWNLERAMGRRNLLAVFLLSILTGGLLSMAMSPGRPSLGASGGDFGLIAASVVFGWKYEDQLPSFARKYFGWAILPYLVYPLCLGLLSPAVDNWGHLGGMLGGALAATWLRPDGFEANTTHNVKGRQLMAAGALLTLFTLSLLGPRLVRVHSIHDQGLISSVPQSWEEGWDFTEDRGWNSPTGRGIWVATSQQLAAPPTPDEALRQFTRQLESRVSAVHLSAREQTEVGGWPATRATLTYRRSGVLQQLELLLICRGATVHRMHLHFDAADAFRYRQLAEKLFASAELELPPELELARGRTRSNPNSWKLAVEHGRQAAIAGYPEEAAEALAKAYRLPRADQAKVAALRLDLYADYGVGLDPMHIDRFLVDHGDSAAVVVAAASALERQDDTRGAQAILEDALRQSPEDLLLKRTLERYQQSQE